MRYVKLERYPSEEVSNLGKLVDPLCAFTTKRLNENLLGYR